MPTVWMFVNVDWFFVSHRLPIANGAGKLGFKLTVFADKSDRCPEFAREGFEFRYSPLRRQRGLINLVTDFFKALSLIRNGNVDVLHAVTVKPIVVVGLIAKILNVPFLASVSGLGPAFSGSGIFYFCRRYLLIKLYKFIFSNKRSRVIVQTDHDREVLLSNAICNNLQLEVIRGSGVDLTRFADLSPHRLRVEGDDTRCFRVLAAARLLRDKGIIEYLEAAELLITEGYGVSFLLAGPFDYDSPTALEEDFVRARCSSIGVEYLGNVEDMPSLLQTLDLFVYPSYYPEGLPKILLEVAAAGVPVITTNHPGCRDAVINGRSGLLVKPRDVNGLKEACVLLLGDASLRAHMSEYAATYARQNFDVNEVVRRHLKLYESLSARV